MEERSPGVLAALEAVRVKMEIGEGAHRSDYEFMRILKEGEEEDNLDKIYQFVAACERGRGLVTDPAVIDLVRKAYETSPERTMQILAGKKHLERCIFLAGCSEEMRIAFVHMGAAGNMLFLYECLRQLLRGSRQSPEKAEALVSGARMLSEGNVTLWERLIRTGEYNRTWQSLLGLVLSGLGEQALIIFAKTIRMDLSEDQCAIISDSLGRMKMEEMERVQQVCAAVLYSRWKEYLEMLHEKKSGLHGIQTSGYQALIFQAIRYVYREQNGWEREVMDSLSLYEEDMCNWYKSVVELSTVFFIHMSKLFLLLCVGAELGFCPGNELRHMLEGAARHMEKLEYLWMDERKKTAMERCLEELLLIFK